MATSAQVELKYVRIASEKSEMDFFWKDVAYKIHFGSESANAMCTSMSISRLDEGHFDPYLLYWLSLFFGEDTREPYPYPLKDNRFNWIRGVLYVDETVLRNYVKKVEQQPSKSYPKWKQELLKMALSYYVIALSTGIDMMPVNLGLLGLSVECLANVHCGKQDDYSTLGEGRYMVLINKRLQKYKRNPKYRKQARSFGKQLSEEFELLTSFRNNYYGHSLVHKREVRKELTEKLRSLYIKQG